MSRWTSFRDWSNPTKRSVSLGGLAGTEGPPPVALDEDAGGWHVALVGVAVGVSLALGAASTAIAVERTVKQHQDEVAFPRVAEDPFIQHRIVDESGIFYVSDSDEQIVPQPVTPALEESQWQTRAVPEPFVVQWTQPWNDELAVQLGEETWQQPVVAQPAVVLWAAPVDDDWVPQPVTFGVDDETFDAVVSFEDVVTYTFYGDDGILTQRVADEDGWWPTQPEQIAPVIRLWTGDDEIVSQPTLLGVDEEGYFPRVVVTNDVFLVESFSFEASALVVEESNWQAPVIQPVAPTIQLWYGDAEIVPQPAAPQIVEDYWTPPHVVAARVWAEAISTDVEIVSTPLPVEETELPWSAQFWVPAPTMGLYLPDPDTWPGGVFAPPVSRLRYDIRTGLWVMILNDRIAISL